MAWFKWVLPEGYMIRGFTAVWQYQEMKEWKTFR